ncbi:MAG: hypoxanthine phosphoribosyltransferase [Eubacteriales bacterium]
MKKDFARVLISRDEISAKIKEVAKKITEDYDGEPVLFVCILKGSIHFYSDLTREIDLPLSMDFMAISSYGAGTTSSGEVKMIKDLDKTISGKNVIIVEDIIDSGNTLSYLMRLLSSRRPKSIKICTLLDKPSRRKVDLTPDYCCFTIPDEFVVGYGLDYDELYRGEKDIYVLDPSVYSDK